MANDGATGLSSIGLAEHINENVSAKRVGLYAWDGANWQRVLVGANGNLQTSTGAAAIRLDDYTTTNVIYVGKALVGTATSAASWSIKKIDQTTGLVITWAGGSSGYTNIWDNRASLSYS